MIHIAIGAHAMLEGIIAGVHGCSSWRTEWARCIGSRKRHASCYQTINIGRVNIDRFVGSDHIISKLINANEQYVFRTIHCGEIQRRVLSSGRRRNAHVHQSCIASKAEFLFCNALLPLDIEDETYTLKADSPDLAHRLEEQFDLTFYPDQQPE